MTSRLELAAAALIAGCAAGRLCDRVNMGDGHRIHGGEPSGEITRVMGRPDEMSSAGRRHENRFGRAGREKDREPKTCVAYLAGGTGQGVEDSPMPPTDGQP